MWCIKVWLHARYNDSIVNILISQFLLIRLIQWWYISGCYRITFLQYWNNILPRWLKMPSRVSLIAILLFLQCGICFISWRLAWEKLRHYLDDLLSVNVQDNFFHGNSCFCKQDRAHKKWFIFSLGMSIPLLSEFKIIKLRHICYKYISWPIDIHSTAIKWIE